MPRAVQGLHALDQAMQVSASRVSRVRRPRLLGGGARRWCRWASRTRSRPPDVAGLQRRREQGAGRRLRAAGLRVVRQKDGAIEAVEGWCRDRVGRGWPRWSPSRNGCGIAGPQLVRLKDRLKPVGGSAVMKAGGALFAPTPVTRVSMKQQARRPAR